MRDIRTIKKKLFSAVRKVITSRKAAYGLAVAAFLSGVATVVSITGRSGRSYDIDTVISLLYIDGILLLLLAVVVIWQLMHLWAERRRGAAGSGLHTRLVVLFSLVAVTPSILVVVFSALFLNFGMQSWFSERVRTALQESMVVATAYLHGHRNIIQTHAFALANELNLNAARLMRDRKLFNDMLSSQSALNSLSEAVVLDSAGHVLARARFSLIPEIETLPINALKTANEGKIAVIDSENEERMRALIRLNRFVDAYLLVERLVDSRVSGHIERINTAVRSYKKMESKRSGIQVSFIIIFVLVAVLLLMAASWVGLVVARHLARPISDLITAAEEVSGGNLDYRVDAGAAIDEIGTLGHAFNNMTSQLQAQQFGLLGANRKLDERRRFTETVLAGVSAGVIGLDAMCKVHLPNRSASELLGLNITEFVDKPLAEAVPELAELLENAMEEPQRAHQGEIRLLRRGGVRTLLVRITGETLESKTIGYVLTFDDVTDLLSAQRKAAWGDVARRIAHEIKNPLTPIQLSAERLRRKYGRTIKDDPDTFITCTETIIRQVEDIGRMVDEFSAFARMPQPVMKLTNLSEICRETVFLEGNRSPDIQIETDFPGTTIMVNCDSYQVSRALANILKNAAESVNARMASDVAVKENGWIHVSLEETLSASNNKSDYLRIIVADNGKGLPEDCERLTEPYVTTRKKGTGLGLAIVRKIMEDHHGNILLENREGGGAVVTLSLPRVQNESKVQARIQETKATPPVKEIAKSLSLGARKG